MKIESKNTTNVRFSVISDLTENILNETVRSVIKCYQMQKKVEILVNIRIARPRNALWRAILRRAILSTSFIRIARPIYFVFFCVDMTFNWFQMLFRASVQDLYALEKFQSTRQQQHLRETQVEVDLDTRCSTSFKLHTSVDFGLHVMFKGQGGWTVVGE